MPTNRFLVDTSVWIFALKKDYSPKIKERIDQLLLKDLIITAGMIKLELLGGTKTESEYRRLKTRLQALDSIETDEFLWESAYTMAFELRRNGITVPYTDILIATCALEAGVTLLHADSHFDLICRKSELRAESLLPILQKTKEI